MHEIIVGLGAKVGAITLSLCNYCNLIPCIPFLFVFVKVSGLGIVYKIMSFVKHDL